MRLFKRWRRKANAPVDKPMASFTLEIYDDKFTFQSHGDEVKVGGALVTLMLRHPYAHALLNNAVAAANTELSRQSLMATYNPN